MRHRDETAEMAVLPGNRRAEDPRRTIQYVAGTEDARRDGQIRGRSRWFIHSPGWRVVDRNKADPIRSRPAWNAVRPLRKCPGKTF